MTPVLEPLYLESVATVLAVHLADKLWNTASRNQSVHCNEMLDITSDTVKRWLVLLGDPNQKPERFIHEQS